MIKYFMLFTILISFACNDTPKKPEILNQEFIKKYQELLDMEPLALDTSKVHLWPGLENTHLTCFMNATLKLMARQKELLNMLKEQPGEDADMANLRKNFKAIINMIRLADKSPAKDNVEFSGFALDSFRESMKKAGGIVETLTDCRQHDANEFLLGMSSALDLEKDTPNNLTIELLAAIKEENPDNTLYDARIREHRDRKGNWIKTEPISGSFPVNKDSTVQKVINDYTDTTIAEVNDTKGLKAWHLKKIYFLSFDKSLIVPVQTTMIENDKNFIRKYMVSIMDKIKLNYLSKIPSDSEISKLNGTQAEFDKSKYQIYDPKNLPVQAKLKEFSLVGIVVHGGSAGGGHYWSFVKDQNGRWYEQNDSRIDKTGKE